MGAGTESGRRWAWLPLLLAAVTVVSCGESQEDRQRQAFDRYKRQVETHCREAVAKIAQRGAPADLAELDRLAPDAIGDAQELVRAVKEIEVPKGSARRVEPLLTDLAAAGDDLGAMEAAIVGAPPTAIEDATGAFHTALVDVDFSGREAGIRCIGPREIKAYDDAATGPVYVARFLRFERYARRKLAGVSLVPRDTRTASVQPLYETVQEVRGRYDLLDVPSYAKTAGEKYSDVLFDLELAYYDVIFARSNGDTPSSGKLRRGIASFARREPRAFDRLIGALRDGLPQPDGPNDDGTTPA